MVKTEGKKDWVRLTKWKKITEQEWRKNRVFKTDEVRKVVGSGNRFVTETKILLQNICSIDFPAGPSEAVVLADSSAVPEFIASDLVAQGEHGPSSAFVLVTDDPSLPDSVWDCMAKQMEKEPKKNIIAQAMLNSRYVVCKNMDLAIETMNGVAPEHICIQVKDPMDVLSKVRNAGSIFVGPYTPIAAGDYASGTNHVLPTSGYATMCSGLTVNMFRKTSTVQMLSREGLCGLASEGRGPPRSRRYRRSKENGR